MSTSPHTLTPTPTGARLRALEEVFHAALDAPSHERHAILDTRCAHDPSLRDEVARLLVAHEAETAVTAKAATTRDEDGARGTRGRRVGPFELDRLLGRGGMGAVYLAHRVDGQFEQRVAVKLIDLPLSTELFRQRFRMERQILASLQHPFIARLLEGGVTEDGEPYLAMEYVEGVPLDRFCAERGLDVRARLRLVREVCAAVQYAHQHLVVHRDLKPDNILVCDDGTPKLLDFGTAKLQEPLPADAMGELTRAGVHSFTPKYASPEQVQGGAVTTASDTYSLGVLMYVLLAGVHPYTLKDTSPVELQRVVGELEPPRPSAVAAQPFGPLDADLDAIILRAMRKSPAARYASVDELSSDVQAYLEGRPVRARAGTLRYRVGKFVRRHKLGLAAGALLAATAFAGVLGVYWQSRVAQSERRLAERRAEALRELSHSLLSELHEAIKRLPGSTPAQRLLVTRILEHLDRLSPDASQDSRLQLDLVNAYTRLGNVQGNPYEQNLGDPEGALGSLGKALEIAQAWRRRGEEDAPAAHDEAARRRALAAATMSRGEVLFGLGRTRESVEAVRVAALEYEALATGAPAEGATAAQAFIEAAAAYGTLGDQYGQAGVASLGDAAAARAAYEKAMAFDERALTLDPSATRARRGLAVMRMKLGDLRAELEPAAALAHYAPALRTLDGLPASARNSVPTMRIRAFVLRKASAALRALRRDREAQVHFDEAHQILAAFALADPVDARAQHDLATLFENEARWAEARGGRAEALSALDKAHEHLRRILALEPHNVPWRANLAAIEARIGSLRGDEVLVGRALTVLRELSASPQATPMVLELAAEGLLDVAPARLRDPRRALALAQRIVTPATQRSPSLQRVLAQALTALGRTREALVAAHAGLALYPPDAAGVAGLPAYSRLRALASLLAGVSPTPAAPTGRQAPSIPVSAPGGRHAPDRAE